MVCSTGLGGVGGAALALVSLATSVAGFYLPGSAPRDYQKGDKVPLLVNRLTSPDNSLIPYDFYDNRLPFPRGAYEKQAAESLGSVLAGDRLWTSSLELYMHQNVSCQQWGETVTLDADQAKFTADLIDQNYLINWLVDGLPAAEMKIDVADGETFSSVGFELGQVDVPLNRPGAGEDPTKRLLNNHYQIYIQTHSPDKGQHQRVVGVLVWPTSVDSLADGGQNPNCGAREPYVLQTESQGGQEVAFTYSVTFVDSPTVWATRWDPYFRLQGRVRFLSIANSILIAAFLLAMVGLIVLRAIRRDLGRYSAIDLDDELGSVQEDFGWKLVANEVFRACRKRTQLALAVGCGAHLAAVSAVTLLFALFAIIGPANRGSLTTVMLVLYNVFGAVAGYVSSRVYATLQGEAPRKNMAVTAGVPGVVLFGVLFLVNLFLIGTGSSGAVPFGTFVALGLLWVLVDVPLSIVGGWIGIRHGALWYPGRVNPIPRQIPPLPPLLQVWPAAMIGSILPFAATFLEMFYALQSLFSSKVYIAYGVAVITFVISALTVGLTTILIVYFALTSEDYRWHWRSFVTGGSCAVWLFGYGLVYWATHLHLTGFTNKFLYVAYLALMSAGTFLIAGTIGFVSCWWFLTVIYSRVRVD